MLAPLVTIKFVHASFKELNENRNTKTRIKNSFLIMFSQPLVVTKILMLRKLGKRRHNLKF